MRKKRESRSTLAAKYEAENQTYLRDFPEAVAVHVVRMGGKICEAALMMPDGEVEVEVVFHNMPSLPFPQPIDVSTSQRSSETSAAETSASETATS